MQKYTLTCTGGDARATPHPHGMHKLHNRLALMRAPQLMAARQRRQKLTTPPLCTCTHRHTFHWYPRYCTRSSTVPRPPAPLPPRAARSNQPSASPRTPSVTVDKSCLMGTSTRPSSSSGFRKSRSLTWGPAFGVGLGARCVWGFPFGEFGCLLAGRGWGVWRLGENG